MTDHRGQVGRRAAIAVVLTLSVAGCAQGVSVAVAPHSSDPACATLVLALPDELGDLPRLRTTSQASAAWGTAAAPVVLRCGVEPPGPTTDRCVNVETPDASIDWVTLAGEPDADGATDWTFTTYGRDPAVELHVPAAVLRERAASFLDQLGPAVATAELTGTCV